MTSNRAVQVNAGSISFAQVLGGERHSSSAGGRMAGARGGDPRGRSHPRPTRSILPSEDSPRKFAGTPAAARLWAFGAGSIVRADERRGPLAQEVQPSPQPPESAIFSAHSFTAREPHAE